MSFEPFSTNPPPLFSGLESEGVRAPSPVPIKSARSRNRAAWWRQDLDRTATYLMGQASTEDERAFVEQLYEQAVEEGPDFINYRAKSAFEAAPRLGIDRNAYARILNALDMIERGTYRHCREKGKQGIPRTVARVLKALLNLALKYGEVRPSLDGIKRLACVCKQTVVKCLKVLTLYGLVLVHRRIKRIRTALGFKVVQDTNAYTIQEPKGLGALAASIFKRASESKKWSASSTEIHPIKRMRPSSQPWSVPDGVYGSIYAQWEAI
jgi:RNA polymerase-binding transcription factor DksA